MYCTCYSAKSTKVEDKQVMVDALEGLIKKLEKEMRDREEAASTDIPGALELPHQTGYQRLLASVLSATDGYVLSATLARYLILHKSRFWSSHDFEWIPFHPLG